MWKITKDYLSPPSSPLNRQGKTSENFDEKKFEDSKKIRLKLFDDDGELYFDAIATEKSILEGDEAEVFDILDWAMNDSGCTELQYEQNKRWETL